jgi:hypothetical protein
MDLTDIYRIFHPAIRQYTFFSAAHETFSKIDHILVHKASLNKYKRIEVTSCMLSDPNTIKLEFRKYSNNWRLNTMLLYDEGVIKEIREEIKKFLKYNDNERMTYQNLWDIANAVLRGKFTPKNI